MDRILCQVRCHGAYISGRKVGHHASIDRAAKAQAHKTFYVRRLRKARYLCWDGIGLISPIAGLPESSVTVRRDQSGDKRL